MTRSAAFRNAPFKHYSVAGTRYRVTRSCAVSDVVSVLRSLRPQTHQPTISLHGAMPPERTWLICPTFSGNEWFTRYAPKGPEGLSPGVLTPGRNISQKASRPEGGVRLRVGKEFKCNAQRSYVSTVLRSFLWTGERLVETKSLNLTPLQGEVRLMGAFPGLKTPGLNPAAPSGRRALNTYRTLVKFHELASINCSLTDSF
jgi:hypothetical protein